MIARQVVRRESFSSEEQICTYAERNSRRREFKFRHILGTILSLRSRGRFLEMGAGPGVLSMMLAGICPGVTITLADISPGMAAAGTGLIREAGLDNRLDCRVGDVADEKFVMSLGTFDCVFSTYALHLWTDPEICLQNLWGAVAPGGLMVIQDYRRGWTALLPFPGWPFDSWRAAVTPAEILKMLRDLQAADIRVSAPLFSMKQTVTAWKK